MFTRCMVAFRKVPVQLAFRGPKELNTPPLKAPSHTADGVKPSVRLLVHTFSMTVGGVTCRSFLHPERG